MVDYFQASDSLFSGSKSPPFPSAHWVVGWVLASQCLSGHVDERKKFRNLKSLRNLNNIKHGDEHCNDIHNGVYVIH